MFLRRGEKGDVKASVPSARSMLLSPCERSHLSVHILCLETHRPPDGHKTLVCLLADSLSVSKRRLHSIATYRSLAQTAGRITQRCCLDGRTSAVSRTKDVRTPCFYLKPRCCSSNLVLQSGNLPRLAVQPRSLTSLCDHAASPRSTSTQPHLAVRPRSLTSLYDHAASPRCTTTQPHLAVRPRSLTSLYDHAASPRCTTTQPHLAVRPPSLTSLYDHAASPHCMSSLTSLYEQPHLAL
ncbi:hypothetical protein NHX12_029198 [Muraenolepis orangiensis]|uniref:Uncharacterized protein n=1 Tax=Muraenolepis orangiensis TaxID=630683 RepID=A0A9Q0EF74_9TELE|nr:hypothetical protein NHX12_029198 [Muraenolepis orangiensis]